MTDEPNKQDQPQPPKPVTVEEFDAVDFEAGLPETKVAPQEFWTPFNEKARQAHEKQEHGASRVYSLMSGICGMHLKPHDRAEPWGPMFVTTTGRSIIPSDLKGEQNAALLAIVDRIKNPGLRARIADIAWTNDRKGAGRAASVAVAAYQESAEGLMDGKFKPRFEDIGHPSFDALKDVQRAFAIAQATTKKDSKGRAQFSDRLKATALKLYNVTREAKAYVAFHQTAELMLHHELIEPAVVAKDLEALAATKPENGYAMPIKSLWEFAAQLHRNAGDKDGEQRCRFEGVKQTLEMRKQVNGSAMAEAHWVHQAILELRHVEGQDEFEAKLRDELRALQGKSTKEMGQFSQKIDLTEMRKKAEEFFKELPLSHCLLEFGHIAYPTPIEQLKHEARESLEKFPMQAMFSASHIDNEGKPIAKSPGADFKGEQSEEWYRQQALRNEDLRRQMIVNGHLHPARIMIHARFQIEERHIAPIVYNSPFVPESQAPLVTLGLARFFQGDFMSATHLLIMQLEPCLRHILKMNGHDPVKQRDDGTEEEFDINGMFKHMRPELVAIFGEDLVYELDLLFVGRPGPSLRNDLAHGLLSAGACFHHHVVYGCWMIYRLSMAFLEEQWMQLAPEIDAVT